MVVEHISISTKPISLNTITSRKESVWNWVRNKRILKMAKMACGVYGTYRSGNVMCEKVE